MTKHGVYTIAEFKALPDDDTGRGRFSALVSVFGNVDHGGDRVVKGAFAKSLDRWRVSGDPIPIIWSHNWGDPNAHIGYADPTDVVETEVGLKVDGNLDLDNPFASQVYRLLKERRVKEMSFGYEVHDEKVAKDGANELLELDLIEAGPTLKGMNSDTQLLGVKADLEKAARRKTPPWHIESDNSECDGYAVVADETGEVVGCHDTRDSAESHMAALYANVEDASKSVKAGRTLSKANEAKLRSAVEAINQVLSSLGEPEEEKSTTPPEGGSEEAHEAETNGKAEDVEANGKASDDALLSLKTQIEMLRSER